MSKADYGIIVKWHTELSIKKKLKSYKEYQKVVKIEENKVFEFKPSKTKRDKLNVLLMEQLYGKHDAELYFKLFPTQKRLEIMIGYWIEFYIEKKLKTEGWFRSHILHYCDFVHSKYPPVQVKNRNNSENSSSKSVRDNKNILFWYRMDCNTGKKQWDRINSIFHTEQKFSEEEFEMFCKQMMPRNDIEK